MSNTTAPHPHTHATPAQAVEATAASAATSAIPHHEGAGTQHDHTIPGHNEPHLATGHAHPETTTAPHKEKHGVAAVIDKIVHPSHHADHKHADEHPVHSHPDVPSVPVAVPRDISDGGAPLAPGGSSVGGIL